MDSRLMLRIIAPTLGVASLLLILGGFAAWYVHQQQRDAAMVLSSTVEKVTAAEELLIISHDLRNAVSDHFDGDGGNLEPVLKVLGRADRQITVCSNLADSDQEEGLVQRIAEGFDGLRTDLTTIAGAKGDAGILQKEWIDLGRKIREQIQQPAREYRALINDQMKQTAVRDQFLADRMGIGLFVLGMCGAVAGLVAGFGFARSVHRSIVQFSVPVHDAAGKLNEVIGPIKVSAETLGDLETTMQLVANRVGTVVQRLQESEAVSRRAEQLASLGQLAAGIAHELRNPLTSMKIIVQTAATDGPPLDGRDLAILTEEITRLESRIQSFLDYARPPKLVTRPVILRDILVQTIDFVSFRARQMGIKIERELPDDVFRVQADEAQVREVLLNLLLNAIDASPENATVLVRLTFEAVADEGYPSRLGNEPSAWIRIDVEDEGEGLPPDVGERIFEPFVSTKESGTGLGLPICRRIVKDHGGQITAANRPGGGAVFSVRLPLNCRELQTCPHS